MIQNKSAADREVTGNLTGEDIKMGVADMAHLLNVVTDLYSDRELACIREYSTNAVDAHIEAGVTAPIEVSTPTGLSTFLTIRDYGVGLDLDDIRTIYSQYGASTKRNTNSQTGMLGLGCKSALTYSDQFTVTSVKDGVRIQVVVSRNAQGASMKVVDTSDTSEANGTTVTIPAKSYNSIDSKAKAFFRYWKPGTVKLNGSEPEFMSHGQRVTDSLYILDADSYNAQSYVVMGGVPYPADIGHNLGYGKAIVAFVGIGEVDFAPSREGLMDTDTTKATLRRVADEFRAALSKSIERDIASASSPAEAATKRIGWSRRVPSNYMPRNVHYKGKPVPDSYKTEYTTILAGMYARKMSSHTTYRKDQFLPIPNVNGSLWVTGFDYVSFTATVRKKLDKYVEDNSLGQITNYILTQPDQKPDTTWLSGVKFIDWPTIKAIKLPRNAVNPRTGRIPGSYDVFKDGSSYIQEGIPGDDIDTSEEVFWMQGGRYDGGSIIYTKLVESYPDCTLVMLRSGREAKFQRLFPSAKNAQKVLKEQFDAWKAKVDRDDALALAMRTAADSRLGDLDVSKLDDPEIKHVKSIIDRDVTDLTTAIKDWNRLGYYYAPDDAADVTNPLDKYVLLPESYYFDRYMKRHGDHIYRYMNNEFLHLTQEAAK